MCTIEEAWGSPSMESKKNSGGNGPVLYDKSYSLFHPISDKITNTPFGAIDNANFEYSDSPPSPTPPPTYNPTQQFNNIRNPMMIPESEFLKMKQMLKLKYKKKCRKLAQSCTCAGTAEHISVCTSCQSSSHKRNEFRHNLTLLLMVCISILLLINLFKK